MTVALADVGRMEVSIAERPALLRERIARAHTRAGTALDFYGACRACTLAEVKTLRVNVTDDELASLVSEVALRVMAKHGSLPARDTYGAHFLSLKAREVIVRGQNSWRDQDSGYRTGHAGKPCKLAELSSVEEASPEGEPVGLLALALMRAGENVGGQLVPIRDDLAALADRIVGELDSDQDRPLTNAQRLDCRTALLASADVSLSTLSAIQGRSLMALHKSKGRGERLIRGRADALALARIIRSCAERDGHLRRAEYPDRVSLSPALLAAREAVDHSRRLAYDQTPRVAGTHAPMLAGTRTDSPRWRSMRPTVGKSLEPHPSIAIRRYSARLAERDAARAIVLAEVAALDARLNP